LQATSNTGHDASDFPSRGTRAVAEPWIPESEADKNAILSHLDALLAHSLFFQSKRYPALLRFVVEQTLAGNADQVKERSIGIEVFARVPGYDANADPVVRVTAGEIRKRLAQYYYDPANQYGIRIELPTGSYVPIFLRMVDVPNRIPDAESAEPLPAHADPALPLGSPDSPAQPLTASQSRRWPSLWMLAPIFLAVAVAAALGGAWWARQASTPPPVDHTVDQFWLPLTSGPATVSICLGEPARDSSKDSDPAQPIERTKPVEPLYFHLHQSGLFALADVVTLTRIVGPLERQHKAFRVSAASEASFAQLREGPVVLIGAYDNLWTMRLTRDLRFGFDSIDGRAIIVDRKSNGKTSWETAWDLPYEKLARDYAIVARFRDPLTGQPVVVASGIAEEGTEAAGELISDPTKLAALLHDAPANWASMNMEAVIETQVIDSHSGPPTVLAIEYW
jgi:hypothetical protein